MALDFRRQFTDGEVGISADGSTASIVWTVSGATSPSEVKNSPDKPVRINSPHPDEPGSYLLCDNLRVATISPTLYRLVASFRVPKNGGTTHPDTTTNPLAEPAKFYWEPIRISDVAEQDSDGNFITASSGRGFDPPPYREYMAMSLKIVRNEPRYSVATGLAWANVVNASAWGDADKGTVRCVGIYPDQPYTAQSSYVAVSYNFEYRPPNVFGPRPFQLRILDQDTMTVRALAENPESPKGLVRLIDYNGDPVDGPIRLDGTGRPLDEGITYRNAIGSIVRNPVWAGQTPPGASVELSANGTAFLKYLKTYPEKEFAQLGLPV